MAHLSLIATPIGNLSDLSPRAAETLREADFWIVEDTRVSGKLAQHLGLKRPMVVCNDHTGDPKLHEYLRRMEAGEHAAMISDGGAPGISDPGARLVDFAHEQGLEVDGIPGPSAVVQALMLSGFYAQRFVFLGFLGRKAGDIRKEFEPFKESSMTLVFFESPHRVDATMTVLGEALPGRRFAITRELTKIHQQIVRGKLPGLPKIEEMPRKGEFTIVLEGRRRLSE
jgi:16S rRNA (cytidine1402-2'-O)-methyltransferase